MYRKIYRKYKVLEEYVFSVYKFAITYFPIVWKK